MPKRTTNPDRRPPIFFPIDREHQAGALWSEGGPGMWESQKTISYPNARGGVVTAPMTGTVTFRFNSIAIPSPDGRHTGKMAVCDLTITSGKWETTFGPVQMGTGVLGCQLNAGQELGFAASSQFQWGLTFDGTAMDPSSVAISMAEPSTEALGGVIQTRPAPPWLVPPKTAAERYLQIRVLLCFEDERMEDLEERAAELEARKASGEEWDESDDLALAAVDRAQDGVEAKIALLEAKAEANRAITSVGEYLVALDKAYAAMKLFIDKAATAPYPLLARDKAELDALSELRDLAREDTLTWDQSSAPALD